MNAVGEMHPRVKDPSADPRETYLPRGERQGIGICLSGGGYRASLFHLGALRRLNEFGLLTHPELRTISSVSGGSITAAQLATAISRHPGDWSTRWNELVERPLLAFTRRNIRTGALAKRLLPWNWAKPSTAVEALAKRYEEHLTDLKLRELPPRPQFVFCATELGFGVNWEFRRDGVGDYQLGVAQTPEDWTVGRAVAASSCFPPLFDPMTIAAEKMAFTGGDARADQPAARAKTMAGIPLNDGGNYDNLGTEPVWKSHKLVIVSDGGGLFKGGAGEGLLWRMQRYVAVVQNQAGALRKRWLIASFLKDVMDGAYFGVASARSSYDPHDTQGYSKDFACDSIAEIRTDLDAFSEVESAVLVNHGYLLADKAIATHVDGKWMSSNPPLEVPFPSFLPPGCKETELARAMRTSGTRTALGRR